MIEPSLEGPLTPRDMPDLIGQEAAEAEFLQAWESGRLAHAWLLTGPKGVGKASLAFRIARFLLSGGPPRGGLFDQAAPATLQMPASHPIFRRIAAGAHADFKLIERGWADDRQSKRRSEIVIADVRDVGAFMALTPAEGGWRVVIVDSADEMNRNSANAILKILEEPPKRAMLLLVSHSPGRLLPTIRSRCRRLALAPLSADQVSTLLARRHPDLPRTEAAGLAALADGSIGRALALQEQGGLGLYSDMTALIERFPDSPGSALHDFCDRVGRQSDSLALLGELLTGWQARAACRAAGGKVAEVMPGEAKLQNRLVGRAGLDRWSRLWERTGHLFERADAVNLDSRQVVLTCFLMFEKAVR